MMPGRRECEIWEVVVEGRVVAQISHWRGCGAGEQQRGLASSGEIRHQSTLLSNNAFSNGSIEKIGRHSPFTDGAASSLVITRGSVTVNVLP